MRFKRLASLLVVVAVALTLSACGERENDSLTAPDGSTYLEIVDGGSRFRVSYPSSSNNVLSEGTSIYNDALVTINVTFHGRGEQDIDVPVSAKAYFVFEDGERYENQAMCYGPFTGKKFSVVAAFRIQDGLAEVAAKKTGQLVRFHLRFTNGLGGNGQDFSIVGFYILPKSSRQW